MTQYPTRFSVTTTCLLVVLLALTFVLLDDVTGKGGEPALGIATVAAASPRPEHQEDLDQEEDDDDDDDDLEDGWDDDEDEDEDEEPVDEVARAREVEERTIRAIDAGIEYLLEKLEKQSMERDDRHDAGQLAFELYALVVAGVSASHPAIEEGLAVAEEKLLSSGGTYGLSSLAFALDAAISQLETDFLMVNPAAKDLEVINHPRIGKPYRKSLKRVIHAVVANQNGTGAWRYNKHSQDYDNSCTQFAVLALGIGAKRGVKIPTRSWDRVFQHFMDSQEPHGPLVMGRLTPEEDTYRDGLELVDSGEDQSGEADSKKAKKRRKGGTRVRDDRKEFEAPFIGTEELDVYSRGWRYLADRDVTWNMTCSGLSSLLVLREYMKLSGDQRKKLDRGIWDGYGWLMDNWSPTVQYYGMYSLEKVADLGKVKAFDGNDWYDQVSTSLLDRQKKGGSWPKGSGHGESERVATAFALLILNRATSLLTSNPAQKMVVVTGGQSEMVTLRDRGWVHIPSRDAHVHWASLLRSIRLRPNVKLMKLLHEAVEGYDEVNRGEMVPGLLAIHPRIRHAGVQKRLAEIIAVVTGFSSPDLARVPAWSEAWEWVHALPGDVKLTPEQEARLGAIYDAWESSLPLRKAVLQGFLGGHTRGGIPYFLAAMGHDDRAFRRIAHRALQGMFLEKIPPFDPEGDDETREAQLAAVREWVEAEQAEQAAQG